MEQIMTMLSWHCIMCRLYWYSARRVSLPRVQPTSIDPSAEQTNMQRLFEKRLLPGRARPYSKPGETSLNGTFYLPSFGKHNPTTHSRDHHGRGTLSYPSENVLSICAVNILRFQDYLLYIIIYRASLLHLIHTRNACKSEIFAQYIGEQVQTPCGGNIAGSQLQSGCPHLDQTTSSSNAPFLWVCTPLWWSVLG